MMEGNSPGPTYPLAYRLEPRPGQPYTREELEANGLGGCDAVVTISLILPEDGSRSSMVLSHDGRAGAEVSDDELFKCMVDLAHRLSESETLGPGRKAFASNIFETVREVILAGRRTIGGGK